MPHPVSSSRIAPSKRVQRLYDLMRFRVRDVLLVSSLYDAYILQEDGHLTEKVFVEYRELRLSSAPRFSHADTAESALVALETRRFDLVLVVSRIQGMSVPAFARRVKERHPSLPVVLLAFETVDYESLGGPREEPALDGIFAWNGDAKILLALSKTIEDLRNVDHDIEVADVRVILLVEDSVRFTSSYLSTLYPELMKQSQSLFSEGMNRLHKLLRMRTRPKILLAQDYEQACLLVDRYRDHLLALISDVEFPRLGEVDSQAGIRLVERVRQSLPDLPILLQSAEADYQEAEARLQVQFANKTSTRLLGQVRTFLRDYLGFGPFIFRMPDGRELRRARDTQELATCIEQVPAASVEYHASRNHFSTWLMARSEFDLAALMRPQRVSDFDSVEDLRRATVTEIRKHEREIRSGVITDFSTLGFQEDCALQRVGKGSLGGKARGIAFLDYLLSMRPDLVERGNLRVRIPQTFVVATNAFDEFLQANGLYALATDQGDDAEIAARFLAAPLPESLRIALRSISRHVHCPLAVRSSSLLEDDLLHPGSGVHETVVLANQHPDPDRRLEELAQAVKLLYASTFFGHARRHLRAMDRSIEEEKMAVVVQQVVGRAQGERFGPFCSGLACTHNFYALPPQRPSEGVVQLALGMGSLGGRYDAVVRFSPAQVNVQPQYHSPAERAQYAPRSFVAVDLRSRFAVEGARPVRALVRYPLEAAHHDALLPLAVSRYVPGARALVPDDEALGERIVTFEGLLRHAELPLAESLRALLALSAAGIGMSVELKFALDLEDDTAGGLRGILYPLELRPLVRKSAQEERGAPMRGGELLCRTPFALGHSPPVDLHDLVYVPPETNASPEKLAQEIAALNDRLRSEGRPYILVGPGRWGDPDRGGIPVTWEQIAGACLLVEAWPRTSGEPPLGAGFFDRVAQYERGYLILPPSAARAPDPTGPFLDWTRLGALSPQSNASAVRHVRSDRPLFARINDPETGGEIFLSSEPSP